MPQIDTADASSARSPSSSPSRPPSHQVNPNTTLIRTQRLQDGRPGGGQDHREVDRRAEQHQAGLDEELGAEAAGQPRRAGRAGSARGCRAGRAGSRRPGTRSPRRSRRTRCPRRRREPSARGSGSAPPGTTTTATPAIAAWSGGRTRRGSSTRRTSMWSLIRAPASRAAGPSAPAPAGAGHDGRGPVFVEGEPASRRDGRVGGRRVGPGRSRTVGGRGGRSGRADRDEGMRVAHRGRGPVR